MSGWHSWHRLSKKKKNKLNSFLIYKNLISLPSPHHSKNVVK